MGGLIALPPCPERQVGGAWRLALDVVWILAGAKRLWGNSVALGQQSVTDHLAGAGALAKGRDLANL